MTEPPEGTPPMTPLASRALPADTDRTAEYARALAALPPGTVPDVLARLDAAVAEAERTGDVGPVRHLLDSLLGTARLQGNEAYLRAVEEADAAEARGDEAPEDVGSFVARMRAKHEG